MNAYNVYVAVKCPWQLDTSTSIRIVKLFEAN